MILQLILVFENSNIRKVLPRSYFAFLQIIFVCTHTVHYNYQSQDNCELLAQQSKQSMSQTEHFLLFFQSTFIVSFRF
jgi:hypothetical protein